MNIKEAKQEVKRIVEVYLDKDAQGRYSIPYMKQRPIFLMGAPGIGKTAIMEQIAEEMKLPLVSYSMTHHTRQSALGLPFISEKEYDGEKFNVSEYTMSEIVTAVYQMREKSGKKEGILFLDEINCVSETLAPAMLLFLQYKVFGNHQIPEGWVVVTAGNPPQYNKSVREFDIATRDRLRCMQITEDMNVWREYAYSAGVHSAILAFLEINKEWFYSIRETVDGSRYVTARGWEDLSKNIIICEKKGYHVDRILVEQFITDEEIVRKFCIYFDLYQKYKSDYQVGDILNGKFGKSLCEQAGDARLDERISLLALITERLREELKYEVLEDAVLSQVASTLRKMKKELGSISLREQIQSEIHERLESIEKRTLSHSISSDDRIIEQDIMGLLQQYMAVCEKARENEKQFDVVKAEFQKLVKKHDKKIMEDKVCLENVFTFISQVWGDKQEMVLFMTELTSSAVCLEFIQKWGCDSYFTYNQNLLIYDIKEQLHQEVLELKLE